jgi:hypothetical protein
MTIKMKEEQILKIDPDLGYQAAVVRAPGACNRAQVVQKRKNRLQPNLYIPGQSWIRNSKFRLTVFHVAVAPHNGSAL